jgi:hypothetical protein
LGGAGAPLTEDIVAPVRYVTVLRKGSVEFVLSWADEDIAESSAHESSVSSMGAFPKG